MCWEGARLAGSAYNHKVSGHKDGDGQFAYWMEQAGVSEGSQAAAARVTTPRLSPPARGFPLLNPVFSLWESEHAAQTCLLLAVSQGLVAIVYQCGRGRLSQWDEAPPGPADNDIYGRCGRQQAQPASPPHLRQRQTALCHTASRPSTRLHLIPLFFFFFS